MNEKTFRKNLVELLRGGHAFVTPAKALEAVSAKKRHVQPGPGLHSVWEELEHIRIAQEDIIRYAMDPSWVSPEFPKGYWPEETNKVTDAMWDASVKEFFNGLDEMIAIAQNEEIDLTAEFPHGEGRTYLRQLLLAADHNSYHLGQIVQTRKLLGDW
ncbi:MAG TPA: DinB family protein [Blastocatellia bacterium]|nr:DinB family protein [Blastocatellia bacterium]